MCKGQGRPAHSELTVVPCGCGGQMEMRVRGCLPPLGDDQFCDSVLCTRIYVFISSLLHQHPLCMGQLNIICLFN